MILSAVHIAQSNPMKVEFCFHISFFAIEVSNFKTFYVREVAFRESFLVPICNYQLFSVMLLCLSWFVGRIRCYWFFKRCFLGGDSNYQKIYCYIVTNKVGIFEFLFMLFYFCSFCPFLPSPLSLSFSTCVNWKF